MELTSSFDEVHLSPGHEGQYFHLPTVRLLGLGRETGLASLPDKGVMGGGPLSCPREAGTPPRLSLGWWSNVVT